MLLHTARANNRMARALAWIASFVVLALAVLWYISNSAAMHSTPQIRQQITLDGQTISVTLATTPAEQERGLGGRSGLSDHEGMLFVFPHDAVYKFWMKDMHFAIDMIWMTGDGTIMYIQPNVSPSTYPHAFGPDTPARYVLEVPANFAQMYGIKAGDTAVLPS